MPPTRRCSRCGRVIGSHLGYPESPGSSKLVCYRCHRLASGGVVPQSLRTAWNAEPERNTQAWVFRMGATMMLVLTFVIVWQTRNVGHALIGAAATLLFFVLWRRTRQKPTDQHTHPPHSGTPD